MASVSLNFCTLPVVVVNGTNESITLICVGSKGEKAHSQPFEWLRMAANGWEWLRMAENGC
jgi:hypothetical protein